MENNERLQRLLREFGESLQRPSSLSPQEQQLISDAIADMRAGRGVRFTPNPYVTGRTSKPLPRPSLPWDDGEEYV